jgi:hypothetical protein
MMSDTFSTQDTYSIVDVINIFIVGYSLTRVNVFHTGLGGSKI